MDERSQVATEAEEQEKEKKEKEEEARKGGENCFTSAAVDDMRMQNAESRLHVKTMGLIIAAGNCNYNFSNDSTMSRQELVG